jgi:hypothetical protein
LKRLFDLGYLKFDPKNEGIKILLKNSFQLECGIDNISKAPRTSQTNDFLKLATTI